MKHLPAQLVTNLLDRRQAQSHWTASLDNEVESWFKIPWRRAGWSVQLIIDLVDAGTPAVDPLESPEVYSARGVLAASIELLNAFARGTIGSLDLAWTDESADVPKTQAYWAAGMLADELRVEGRGPQTIRWFTITESAADALRIVQKWASSSNGDGNGPNPIVERVCLRMLRERLIEVEDLAVMVRHIRFVDACGPGVVGEDVRIAFYAAWDLGKYELAYQLAR